MPIIIKCDCGKTLKIDEKYRGRQAACPVCKKAVMVEGPNEDCSASVLIEPEAAVQPAKLAANPAKAPAAPAQDPANPFAVSATGPSTRPRRRSMVPWITAGCGCLTVLLTGCSGIGFAFYWFFLRPYDEDFKFVNAEVAGFYSIRVADIMKSEAFKAQMGKVPLREKESFEKKLAEIDKKLGQTFTDLERVTFISRTAADTGVVLRTTKPMNKKKIFATFSAEKSEKKEGNATYFVLERPDENPIFLHFVSGDKVVLMTHTEASMKDFLNLMDKPAIDPTLRRGIKMASSGSYAFVMALKVEQNVAGKHLQFQGVDELMVTMPGMREMNGLILSAAIDQRMNLEVNAFFASGDQASRAKSEFDEFIRKAKARPVPPGGGGDFLAGLLDTLTVTQSGAEIAVRGKSDVPLGMLTAQISRVRLQSPGQKRSRENLEKIARAIRQYERVNGKFPAGGHKGTVSWRVLILPYLPDNDGMFEQINVNEAFDTPHNRQFHNKMPKVYQLPTKNNDGKTYYQVFRGPDSAFPDMAKDIRMKDISDGPANTIFIVEATDPVQWMRPEDLSFRINTTGYSGKSLGNHWGDDTFHAAFGDDRVRRLPRSIESLTLQAMITRAQGEKINMAPFEDNEPPGGFDEP